MISKIKFIEYRKFKDIEVSFSKGINIISGINGTCKTSLLHIIANSFKKVKKNDAFIDFNKLNVMVNPKIETLAKQARTYSDPNKNVKGILYTVEYFDKRKLSFRKKNDSVGSDANTRFRVIPKYESHKNEKLPSVPIIYLGLTRLIPFQQIEDKSFKMSSINVPEEVINDTISIYNELLNEKIIIDNKNDFVNFENIKKRINFKTDSKEIDSNTISDGQDNLYSIATALASLKYINIQKISQESILLIDELDATLHPDLQIRLLDKLYHYSKSYNIQVVSTTHSIDIVEKSLNNMRRNKEYNVIYITNKNKLEVDILGKDDLNIEIIKSKLYCININDLYSDKIVIISEDKEAQLFLNELFISFGEKDKCFEKIRKRLYIAESTIGCGNIINIFSSESNKKIFSEKQIGIVDGDCNNNKVLLDNNLIKLPGDDSPEILLFKYCKCKDDSNSDNFFNKNQFNNENAYDYNFYQQHLKTKINECIEKSDREKNKQLFNSYLDYFVYVMKYWIDENNQSETVKRFKCNIEALYNKILSKS